MSRISFHPSARSTGYSLQRAALWALAPLLVLTPALTCVSPRIMAAMFIACGVIALVIHIFQARSLPKVDRHWLYALAAFVAYGCLGQIWTINPDETLSKTVELGGIFLLGLGLHGYLKSLDDADTARIGRMLAIGFWLGAAVFLFEQQTGHWLYDFVRGGETRDVVDVKVNRAGYVIALWAALAFPFYWRRVMFGWGAAAVALIYVVFTAKSLSLQALVLALPVLVLALRYMPTWVALRFAVLGSVLVFTLMPLLSMGLYRTYDLQNPDANGSITSRIEIWNQAAERVREKPLLGWGMDTASVLPNRGEISVIPAYRELNRGIAHLHPHNAPMQIWFELGGVGIAWVCAVFLLFMRGVRHMDDHAQKYAVFMWAVMMMGTLASWGIWQSWFTASLVFAAAITATATRRF